MSRSRLAKEINRTEVDWKRAVADVLQEMNIIKDGFSGTVVINFKDGGISYLEKKEVFK